MRIPRPSPVLLLGALSLLGLLGTSACGRRKIAECNSLIQVINSGVQSLDKRARVPGGEGAANEWSALGEAMEKAARDAGAVSATVPELKTLASEYQGMASDVAKAARSMADAAKAKDVARVNEAQAAMEGAVKQEDAIVERINKVCQAP